MFYSLQRLNTILASHEDNHNRRFFFFCDFLKEIISFSYTIDETKGKEQYTIRKKKKYFIFI